MCIEGYSVDLWYVGSCSITIPRRNHSLSITWVAFGLVIPFAPESNRHRLHHRETRQSWTKLSLCWQLVDSYKYPRTPQHRLYTTTKSDQPFLESPHHLPRKFITILLPFNPEWILLSMTAERETPFLRTVHHLHHTGTSHVVVTPRQTDSIRIKFHLNRREGAPSVSQLNRPLTSLASQIEYDATIYSLPSPTSQVSYLPTTERGPFSIELHLRHVRYRKSQRSDWLPSYFRPESILLRWWSRWVIRRRRRNRNKIYKGWLEEEEGR